jgi:uroporphyrinogen-III synthase
MRVLVTRPAEDARRTAERLARLGHEPVLAPLTEIVETGAPPPAGTFDGLVLTSAHAVPAARRVPLPDGAAAFAVGRRTAAAAREAGFGDVRVAEGDAAALAALVARTLPPGARLLHVTGRHRKAEPDRSLRAAGHAVQVWEAYEAAARGRLPDNLPPLLRAGAIDAVLHYSRRSAALLVDLCAREGLGSSLRAPSHVCLSADVASALVALGVEPVVAARPDEDALLEALGGTATAPGSPPTVP